MAAYCCFDCLKPRTGVTLPEKEVIGAQGVALTPGYSLAVDRKWVPLGAPVWLSTTRPVEKTEKQKAFQRLMVAQDTLLLCYKDAT